MTGSPPGARPADLGPCGRLRLPEPHPALRTRLVERLGIRYPIVQTGMGWVAGPRLVAATAEAGGLGILASATMSIDHLRSAVAEVRSRTANPFGVNVRSDATDVDDRITLLVESGVQVVSFAQAPRPAQVERLRRAGTVVMPTVGAVRHAQKVADLGVDAVMAQGSEGGGHTGQVPTSLLLPSVVDAVSRDTMVVGAGGFFDGRGLVAALAHGADGMAMGTRFLLTADSRVPDGIKARYLATTTAGTVVTTSIDGAPQRVVRTEMVDRLDGAGRLTRLPRAAANALAFRRTSGRSVRSLAREGLAMHKRHQIPWAQVLMAANAPMMTRAALVDGQEDAGILPTGQVVGLVDGLPTVAELIHDIVVGANGVLERLGA